MKFKSLDFLRGVAILLVVFRHLKLDPILQTIGWIGVDLFFVLSGFLVSNLLFKEYNTTSSIKPIRFLIRRGLKIYPLFYLMIFILFLILIKSKPELYMVYKARLLNELFFIQNYRYSETLTGHTWSLAVEEHFYFSLVLLFFIFSKFKILNNRLLFNSLTIIVIISCLLMRIKAVSSVSELDMGIFMTPTHLRFDSLWIGVFIAFHYNYSLDTFKNIFRNNIWLCFILFPIVLSYYYSLDNYFLATYGLTIIYFCFGITLCSLIFSKNSEKVLVNIFGNRIVNILAKVGTYSYAIYLFHKLVTWYLNRTYADVFYNSLKGRILTFIAFLIIMFTGIVATEFIEKPILKWRDKAIY